MTDTVIYKYPVLFSQMVVSLPQGAEVLCVQVQNGEPHIWVRVPIALEARIEQRKFRVYGTGHVISADIGKYIGTFQLYDGTFIGHLFEENT